MQKGYDRFRLNGNPIQVWSCGRLLFSISLFPVPCSPFPFSQSHDVLIQGHSAIHVLNCFQIRSEIIDIIVDIVFRSALKSSTS